MVRSQRSIEGIPGNKKFKHTHLQDKERVLRKKQSSPQPDLKIQPSRTVNKKICCLYPPTQHYILTAQATNITYQETF